jgi:ABC-2 type transport system permease protein
MRRLRGFRKLTWIELKLFARDPFALAFVLILPFFMLLLLATVFGDAAEETPDGRLVFRGLGGPNYYMATSIVAVIAAIGLLVVPMHIASYREQGVLRRLRASGVTAWEVLASQLAISMVVAFAGSAAMVAVVVPAFGTRLPEAPIGVLAAFVMSAVSLAAIGGLLGALAPTARAAQGIGLLLFFGCWMLSGGGPPRAVLPEGVRRMTEVLPLTHANIALQDP